MSVAIDRDLPDRTAESQPPPSNTAPARRGTSSPVGTTRTKPTIAYPERKLQLSGLNLVRPSTSPMSWPSLPREQLAPPTRAQEKGGATTTRTPPMHANHHRDHINDPCNHLRTPDLHAASRSHGHHLSEEKSFSNLPPEPTSTWTEGAHHRALRPSAIPRASHRRHRATECRHVRGGQPSTA